MKPPKTNVSVETNLYSSYVKTKSVTGELHPTAVWLSLLFAIPDHPWVDNANGAAVRIVMTVAARGADCDAANLRSDPSPQCAGADPNFAAREVGRLLTVITEQTGEHGEVNVTLSERTGVIPADLNIGASLTDIKPLQANQKLSDRGVQISGEGFIVTPEEGTTLCQAPLICDYRNGRDLTDTPRGVKVIDAFGLGAEQIDNHRKRVLGILPLPSNRGEPKTSETLGREWTVTDFGGFMRAPAIPAPAHPDADDQGSRTTPRQEAAPSGRSAELGSQPKSVAPFGPAPTPCPELGSDPNSAPPVPAARNLPLTGTFRWLCQEFQNPPKSLSNKELRAQVQQALGMDFVSEKQSLFDSNKVTRSNAAATQSAGVAIQAWPATLPDQVGAYA